MSRGEHLSFGDIVTQLALRDAYSDNANRKPSG